MTLLENWVAMPAAKALGWTLFHSLWEGAMVALVLAAVLWAVRPSHVRYAAACLAMLAMLAGFGLTFARALDQQRMPAGARTFARAIPPAPDDLSGSARAALRTSGPGAADVLPWLALFWIAGVLLFHLRGLASWMAAQRLCRTGVCRAPDFWQERLKQLGARLRLTRPVSLLESSLAGVPVVIGYWRPLILMPVGLLAGLPAGQIDAILLHELAHIRRCDYLVNLLQTFVEGLLFYHPAVWWISAVIREERENCCDDAVVSTHGDPHQYALVLAALEQSRSAVPAAATAVTGGNLVKRIRRLLAPPERPRAGLTPVFSAIIVTMTAALALTAWQTPQRPAPAAPPLAGPWALWLNEDVAYIITDAERRAFESLRSDEEREHFSEQFWQRRDPNPGAGENAFKKEHYRRLQYANDRFGTATTDGWKTDRGRIYITYGPPDEIESHPSGGTYVRPPQEGGGTISTYPFEQWRYGHIQGVGDSVIIEFVDPTGTGAYRMTTDPYGKDAGMNRSGATVEVLRNGTARIAIPLMSYSEHPVTVSGRLVTSKHQLVGTFEESARPAGTAGQVYTKLVAVRPGSYQLYLAVRDLTTNALYTDNLAFDVQ